MGAFQRDVLHDAAQLDVRLRCPRCSANLISYDCTKCKLQLRESGGIIYALPPERVDHYAQFIRDYERIRAEEGRGSACDDFYLNLPYRDNSGRNGKQWRIRARTYDYVVKHLLPSSLPASGKVLDLGAGNCWMCYRLALAGYRTYAVDLLTNSYDGLGAAVRYQKHLPGYFPRFQAELAHLPFQDHQFDAIVFNASFHYAEDASAVLQEALRCATKSGIVVISDTPWYSCEESGNIMVHERRSAFLERYGTASASIESIEFLTDERLRYLEEHLAIRWSIYFPRYGLRWAMRPFWAMLLQKREPAEFRIFVARKAHM